MSSSTTLWIVVAVIAYLVLSNKSDKGGGAGSGQRPSLLPPAAPVKRIPLPPAFLYKPFRNKYPLPTIGS